MTTILLYILVVLLAVLSILLLRRIVGNVLMGDFDDDY